MIAHLTDPPTATVMTSRGQILPQHISPTAAKTYLGCSLKFYFERVTCIRKKTTAALHLGKAVHAALQAFHLARWRGADDSPETIAAAYEKAFSDLERDEGPVNFKTDADREKCRVDGLRVVAAYLDSPEAMKNKPRAVEVLLKEDNRLTTFIDSFRSLNFAGDQQLEQTLERFRRDLLQRSAEDYRNDSGAMANLTEGLSRLRENAVQLARTDARDVISRFGQLGTRKLAAVS